MAKASTMVKLEAMEEEVQREVLDRSVIRSQYIIIKSVIFEKKDDIMRAESDEFNAIMNEVETLHQHVQRPREQVADAAALLDLANTLVTSSKAHTNGGLTPSYFVTSLLRNFGTKTALGNVRNVVSWADIGFVVSRLFQKAGGCSTMMGPMKTEMKQRASVVHERVASPISWTGLMRTAMKQRASAVCRRMTRPVKTARPEEVATIEEDKSSTDKNMLIMFDILRKKRSVRLESLVLNRKSFAQTIENIFALSFLVKDGRVEITMSDSGHHLVSPRNAPAASAISLGEVRYHHFVFRFDFKDWKLMAEAVGVGEELMPHRCSTNTTVTYNSRRPTTPARKLCRNRGLIVQGHSIGNCPTLEEKLAAAAAAAGGGDPPKPRKRRISFD